MISIIIPTYNRKDALERCVDSLLDQVYDGMEIIIIDDFSNDSTKSYLASIKAKHSFIKVILNQENQGVNFTRNRGIEVANNRYILFLDSDDQLAPGGLANIVNTIDIFKDIKHFLFVVSDRKEEFEAVTQPVRVEYGDWITGKQSRDFTHVVLTEIMKQYLFHEEFRMFEVLNWLRVFKATTPQLLIPQITTIRERNRGDSLTSNTRLTNKLIISNTFDAQSLYYKLYRTDLQHYNSGLLTYGLLKTILLGIASDKKKECNALSSYANNGYARLLGQLLVYLPSFVVRQSIIIFSLLKRTLATPAKF